MNGNTWQWTRSSDRDRYKKMLASGPFALDALHVAEQPGMRIIRGGSWNSTWDRGRCAARSRMSSELADKGVGFRVALRRRGA